MQQIIKRVTAVPLRIKVNFKGIGIDRPRDVSMTHVEIESADGLVGQGLGYFADSFVLATMVERLAAPALLGRDAIDSEACWQALYWTLTSSGQSGYGFSAISALDIAIWDLKAQALGLPIWRLLGGYRKDLPAYATLGVPGMTREELVAMGRWLVGRGFRSLKMHAGRPGLDRTSVRIEPEAIVREDIARVRTLREAVGPDVEISIDGACRLDLVNAMAVARGVEKYDIAWYEEPLLQNDPQLLAQMRRMTSIKLAAGQAEGPAYRFRELLINEAVDVIQPNVVVAGGFTQCVRIAGLAAAFNAPVANGGGAPFHNMHFQAGVPNGMGIEYQTVAVAAAELLYEGLPDIAQAHFEMPTAPGLGFKARPEALAEFRVT